MSNRDEFDSGNTYVELRDFLGSLILFTPTEYIPVEYKKNPTTGETLLDSQGKPMILSGITTVHGVKDAVITDMVVFGSNGAETYHDVMILQGKLIGALKNRAKSGRKFLGVLETGEARRGQNAPFQLANPDEKQKQIARDFLAGKAVEAATSPVEEDDPFKV
jgi:hypothetical protein